VKAVEINTGDIVINEVQYDPAQGGIDSAFEWLELYNRTCVALTLIDWKITDNNSDDCIPTAHIPPRGFLVIAAGVDFYEIFPDFSGNVTFVDDGTIGNGLNNNGDRLSLVDVNGMVIDSLSYGDDTTVMSPSCRDVKEGHSLERYPAGLDTNRSVDFVDNGIPSPGYGLEITISAPTFMPSPTPAGYPTPSPAPIVTSTPIYTSKFSHIENNPLIPTLPITTATPVGLDSTSLYTPVVTGLPFSATPYISMKPLLSPVDTLPSNNGNGNAPLYIGIYSFFALAWAITLAAFVWGRKKS
jgi:hypothetical protein